MGGVRGWQWGGHPAPLQTAGAARSQHVTGLGFVGPESFTTWGMFYPYVEVPLLRGSCPLRLRPSPGRLTGSWCLPPPTAVGFLLHHMDLDSPPMAPPLSFKDTLFGSNTPPCTPFWGPDSLRPRLPTLLSSFPISLRPNPTPTVHHVSCNPLPCLSPSSHFSLHRILSPAEHGCGGDVCVHPQPEDLQSHCTRAVSKLSRVLLRFFH